MITPFTELIGARRGNLIAPTYCGHNHSTEGVALPQSWAWFKYDTKY